MSKNEDAHTAWAEAVRAQADARSIPSGILDLSPLAPHRVDGRSRLEAVTRETWSEIYYRLRNGALPAVMPRSNEEIEAVARTYHHKGVVPIAIGRYRYHQLRETGQPIEQAQEQRAFFAAALEEVVHHFVFPLPAEHRGLSVRYFVPSELYLSNQDGRPQSVEIDFDDGNGRRKVAFDEEVSIDYTTPGTKRLRVWAEFPEGVEEALFELPIVQATVPPAPNATWTLISSASGATGTAYVLYANGRSLGQKVMLLSEGFPGGSTVENLWTSLDIKPAATSNLARQLLDAGTDVIFVTYAAGVRAVEENAGVVINCIQKVIASSPSAALIVGGESMGGLITRFALAQMESQQIAHNTSVFYSIDTPHDGASVPLSVQCAINLLAPFSAAVDGMRQLLNTPAAQEMMLIVYPNFPAASMPSPQRTSFLANLAAVGDFPKRPRLVGVSNGTADGQRNGLAPGSLALSYKIGRVTSLLFAAPGSSNGSVLADSDVAFSFPSGAPLVGKPAFDSAPGGTFNVFALMAGYLQAANAQIISQTNAPATFIPAISSTAMEDLSCYSAADLITPLTSGNSKLDVWLADTSDEPHVTVTQPIATFLQQQFAGQSQQTAAEQPSTRGTGRGSARHRQGG